MVLVSCAAKVNVRHFVIGWMNHCFTSRWDRKVTLHARAPESFEENETLAFTNSPRPSLELTSCLILIKAAWNSAALAPFGISRDTSPAKCNRKELNQYSEQQEAGGSWSARYTRHHERHDICPERLPLTKWFIHDNYRSNRVSSISSKVAQLLYL